MITIPFRHLNTAVLIISSAFATSAVAQTVVRGPYLQMGTPESVVVRWRTDQPTDSVVRYGTSLASQNESDIENDFTTEHEVLVSGLASNTEYFYSVGSTAEVLAGGEYSYSFVVAPAAGSSKATRIWILGDSGTANSDAVDVRDAFHDFTAARRPDIWLMLGDNAYDDGTDFEYQAAVFDMYPETLRQAVLWSTLGNHDGVSANSLTESGPYYDIFTLPANAEAGGLASGTEAYYSFDYGNIHFISLDSHETDRSTDGAMLTWLENDLAATTGDWLIAFWHHPPYTKGSHDSDSESQLVEMRRNAVPILERYGVDLVLSGHSHSYERTFLIDGHHGSSNSFDQSMTVDGGSGRDDDTGAYEKAVDGASNQGAVYAVAGSSGRRGGGPLDHPAMYLSLNSLGSMVLDVSGERLDAHFIDASAATRDYFSITKGRDTTPPSLLEVEVLANSTVVARFSESLQGVTAENVANYAIDNGVSIVDAQPGQHGLQVSLTTSTMQADVTHTLTVNNVTDLAGNTISDNSRLEFMLAATEPPRPADAVAPTVPDSVRITDVGITFATLAWDPSNDNVAVTGYRVRRDRSVIGTTSGTSINDDDLLAGKAYSYSVSAFDAAGNESPESSPLLVVTENEAADNGASDNASGATGTGSFDLLFVVLLMAVAAVRRFLPSRRRCLVGLAIFLTIAPGVALSDPHIQLRIERLNAKIREEPDNYLLYMRRSNLFRKHWEFDAALADLSTAVEKGPPDFQYAADLLRGQTLLAAGQGQLALPAVDNFVSSRPEHVGGRLLRAQIHESLGHVEAAVWDYSIAIEMQPRPDPDLYLTRARLLVSTHPGRYEESLQGIDSGIARLGPLVSLVECAIDLEIDRQNFAAAIRRVDSLPDSLVRQPRWLVRRARLLQSSGRIAEAAVGFDQAMAAIAALPDNRRNVAANVQLKASIQSSMAALVATDSPPQN